MRGVVEEEEAAAAEEEEMVWGAEASQLYQTPDLNRDGFYCLPLYH